MSIARVQPRSRTLKRAIPQLGAIDSAGTPQLPIERAIRNRLEQDRKALVPFFTAGFPDLETFIALLREADEIGCDAIEVGIPFSDPIADGPAIQFASQCSLDHGMNIETALAAIEKACVNAPVIVMGYLNPILAHGVKRFVRDAQAAGVAGLIVPDAPLDESRAGRFKRNRSSNDGTNGELDLSPLSMPWERILLAAPTTTRRRLKAIGAATKGFLYAVTVTGITGSRSTLPPTTIEFLTRAVSVTQKPILAGFGIGNSAIARKVAAHCDGVIVGSALIETMRNQSPRRALKGATGFLKDLRCVL